MNESVVSQLKSETQHIHFELESTAIVKNISGESVGEKDVLLFLNANYACLYGLEQYLEHQLGGGALREYWGYTSQAARIRDDFQLLELPLPEPHGLEWFGGVNHALGGLYVLIGSQFGKAVIRKHLQRKDQEFLSRLSFFQDVSSLSQRWTSFSAKLDQVITTPEALQESKAGARQFFSHFLRYWQAGAVGERASRPEQVAG